MLPAGRRISSLFRNCTRGLQSSSVKFQQAEGKSRANSNNVHLGLLEKLLWLGDELIRCSVSADMIETE